jgi:hypothetical protein
MPVNGAAMGGGIRPGSGRLMAAGGGSPRCDVLILSLAPEQMSGGRESRSALGENFLC